MARRSSRSRLKAEMNIVPYIDVMFVLLIIFMVTASMINQGVEVELPQEEVGDVQPQADADLIILTVRSEGYFLNIADEPDKPQGEPDIVARAQAQLTRNPQTPVLVRGDKGVEYGKVAHAMALLKQAGAPKVGLAIELPEG
ncbi:MAG TPA: ExbD/TolR family protein [Nevskiales bacterium]|nr:ExbD/TolR family protein [Nevskiales bacterium]